MSPRSAYAKTNRFLEILALLTLAIPQLGSDLSFSPLFWSQILAALLLGVALLYRPLRQTAWVATLAAGLVSLWAQPELEGTLLVLLAAFLIFDSGWLARYTMAAAVSLGAVVVAVQLGSLFFYPHGTADIVRLVVTDILIAGLTVTFACTSRVSTASCRCLA